MVLKVYFNFRFLQLLSQEIYFRILTSFRFRWFVNCEVLIFIQLISRFHSTEIQVR